MLRLSRLPAAGVPAGSACVRLLEALALGAVRYAVGRNAVWRLRAFERTCFPNTASGYWLSKCAFESSAERWRADFVPSLSVWAFTQKSHSHFAPASSMCLAKVALCITSREHGQTAAQHAG